MRRRSVLAASVALIALGMSFWSRGTLTAQNRGATGSIAGTVTADRGEVRALRVKATDTVHKISYTVFTTKGRYQIFNLPASTYSVRVVEEEFEGPAQTVEVRSGQAAAANLAVTFKEVIV